MSLEKYVEDYGKLVEGGFVAVKQGNRSAAEKLFHAAALLRPEATAPQLGFGYVALNALDLHTAREKLQLVLDKEPDNAMAKVLLGFCFLLARLESGSKKNRAQHFLKPEEIESLTQAGKKLIQEGLKSTQDPGITRLGESALELCKQVEEYHANPVR